MMEKQYNYPERIIQFGEGNFLRAFVDWMVQKMNDTVNFNSGIVVVQPIKNGMVDKLNEQSCNYTVVLKGLKQKKAVRDVEVIKSISRCINPYASFEEYLKLAEIPEMRFIVSNTTEAGIIMDTTDLLEMKPCNSFPGKLLQLLYRRYQYFQGDKTKGFVILPCELIEANGTKLRNIILELSEKWGLEQGFTEWLKNCNTFCNTLVDRIVSGFNSETAKEIEKSSNFYDNLLTEGEQFHLWVIEGPQWIKNELPVEKAGLNVLVVDDVTPYRTRKVRILNAPHTIMAPIAYLCGIQYVRQAIEHPVLGRFIKNVIYNEIIPTINLPKNELDLFVEEVLDRFLNPFVNHALISISLNSISKYKARVLPSALEYLNKNGELPRGMVLGLTAIIVFYRGKNGQEIINVQDDVEILNEFKTLWEQFDAKEISINQLVYTVLSNSNFWGEDLTKIEGLAELVENNIAQVLEQGMLAVVKLITK